MGNEFGRQVLGNVGTSIRVSADGKPEYKVGGVTMDWTVVDPVSGADVTLEDGVVIEIGDRYLRYGTIVYKLGSGLYGVALAATTLVRGETFIVDRTVLESGRHSNHPPVFDGGRVFKERLLLGGANPTLANFLVAFPRISFV